MSASIGKYERLECPAEFQQFITDIFGVNYFGMPNFDIVWGQTATYVRATRHGYRDGLVGHGNPAWIIRQWMAPEFYGRPETYYYFTADPETGLSLLGEYPEFGRYEVLVPLMSKRMDGNELVVETLPLDWEIIERVMPVLMAAQALTALQLKAAVEANEARENAEEVAKIADELFDELPSFYGPVSFADQRDRTSKIDRMKEKISRDWAKRDTRKQPARGFYQGKPVN
jgi:hypothetical protein